MTGYWLLKSEPASWSWSQQQAAGTSEWSGVRNFQAASNLKAMRVGDQAFFYHSNVGKEIVGIVRIVREAYPDPGDAAGRFVMVDVAAVTSLARPVTLGEIKRDPALEQMALRKQSRLSVQPVTQAEWDHVRKLGHT